MAALKLLLPFNFMPQDQKAMDFVTTTFAGREGVETTLFHVYTPVPEIDSAQNPILEKMKANLNYLSQVIRERQEELDRERGRLVDRGLSEGGVRTIYRPRKKDLAAEIVDAVRETRCDMVVLNRKPGKVGRFFSGNTFSKVIASLKGVTVCVVS